MWTLLRSSWGNLNPRQAGLPAYPQPSQPTPPVTPGLPSSSGGLPAAFSLGSSILSGPGPGPLAEAPGTPFSDRLHPVMSQSLLTSWAQPWARGRLHLEEWQRLPSWRWPHHTGRLCRGSHLGSAGLQGDPGHSPLKHLWTHTSPSSGVTQVLGPSSHEYPKCQVVPSTHHSPKGTRALEMRQPQPGSLRSLTGSVTAQRKGVGRERGPDPKTRSASKRNQAETVHDQGFTDNGTQPWINGKGGGTQAGAAATLRERPCARTCRVH